MKKYNEYDIEQEHSSLECNAQQETCNHKQDIRNQHNPSTSGKSGKA